MTSTARDLADLLTRLVTMRDSWRDASNMTAGDYVPAERETFRKCADMLSEALDGFDLRRVAAPTSVRLDSVEAAIAEAERNLGNDALRIRAMELTLIYIGEQLQASEMSNEILFDNIVPLITRATEAGVPKLAATG